MKIQTITSSKKNIIEQDVLSQMYVFNMLQRIQSELEKEINQENYKHKMKININMAVGYIKKYMIKILLKNDKKEREKLLEILDNKILKHIVPVRENRNYERGREKLNKNPINKRKTF